MHSGNKKEQKLEKQEKSEKDKTIKSQRNRAKSLSIEPKKSISTSAPIITPRKTQQDAPLGPLKRMIHSEGMVLVNDTTNEQLQIDTTTLSSSPEKEKHDKTITYKRDSTSASRSTSPKRYSIHSGIHSGLFSLPLRRDSGSSIDSNPEKKSQTDSPKQQSPKKENKIKRYSYLEILDQPFCTHDYLFSLTQDQIEDFYKQASKTHEKYLGSKDGGIVFHPDYKKSSPKKGTKSQSNMPPEIIISVENKVPVYILGDPNIQLGGPKGAGGFVYVGYVIPELLDHKWCTTMIDSMMVIKKKDSVPKTERIKMAIKGLQELDQFINFYDCNSFVYYAMRPVQGPNLAQVICTYNPEPSKPAEDPTGYINVFEYRRYIPPKIIMKYMIKILEAYIKFHKAPLIHADVKPQNLVVTPDDEIEIVDTDDVTHTDTIYKKVIGSPGWVVPELQENSHYPDRLTQKSDIYAKALVCCILATRKNYLKQIRKEQVKRKKEWTEANERLKIENQTADQKKADEKKVKKFMYPDYFRHKDYVRILSDIFIDPLPIQSFFDNDKWKHLNEIPLDFKKTWMNLPTEDLFEFIKPSLIENFLPADLLLFSKNRKDIMSEIVFQNFIWPLLIPPFLSMVCENPELRAAPTDMPEILEVFKKCNGILKQISGGFTGPMKVEAEIPAYLQDITREKIMKWGIKETKENIETFKYKMM